MSNKGLKSSSLLNQSGTENKTENVSRRLFLMRHGERVDFAFPNWITASFDKNGTYQRTDLNMPETIPQRSKWPNGYLKDSPLSNVGIFQARKVGEGLKDKNMDIAYAYSSPSLRSIQTCDSVLRGCNKQESIKIRVDSGLFEWGCWYEYKYPDFMTVEELVAAGFNIDTAYKPTITVSELQQNQEILSEHYQRNNLVVKSALSAHPDGNILFVGHSGTLEVCSRELLGKKPRTVEQMIEVIKKIPYCGIVQLVGADDRTWEMLELPCLPLTHTNNHTFDPTILWIDEPIKS